jgi:hypothetical protein
MAQESVRWRQVCLGLLCTLSLAVAWGCRSGPRRVPVSGEVTLDGAPLSGGVIHFYPDTAKGNEHRVDCLSPVRSGKYNLLTQAVKDSETGNGAPLGWYKVYLYTDLPGVDIKIHERFTDPYRTPISVEVVENPAPGAYDVKFTSK